MNQNLVARLAENFVPARFLLATALLLVGSFARASVVEIVWDHEGNFEHRAELEAGGFAEVCGALSLDERVRWAFDASAALDFNIHYHEGAEVVYPAEFPSTVERTDVLVAPVEQTYCWMWTNRLDSPVTVTLRLSH